MRLYEIEMSPNGKIGVILLADRRQFTTASAGAIRLILGRPFQFGPLIKGITVHSLGEDFGAGFAWSLDFEWSFDGETWYPTGVVLESGAVAGNKISAQYTTATNFGRYIRFVFTAGAGGPGITGTVSLMVALEFHS